MLFERILRPQPTGKDHGDYLPHLLIGRSLGSIFAGGDSSQEEDTARIASLFSCSSEKRFVVMTFFLLVVTFEKLWILNLETKP